MSRGIKLRVSFQNDIGFLARLVQAIELDEFMLPAEKREACHGLEKVMSVFHEVEHRRFSLADKASEKPKEQAEETGT